MNLHFTDASMVVMGMRYGLEHDDVNAWRWSHAAPVCPDCDLDIPATVSDEPSGARFIVCDCGARYGVDA